MTVAHEFRLPDIGEGLTEAVVTEWYVAVGEEVAMDAPLVEMETDKAVTDIPSPFGGVLLFRGGEAGDTIRVGEILAVVGAAGEEWAPPEIGEAVTMEEPAPIVGTLEGEPQRLGARPQTLPAVRRLAAELGVALEAVGGSGPGGRITEDDVRRTAGSAGPVERRPLSPTRRAIAANLARSWREIPHVTTYAEAPAAELLLARRRAAEAAGTAVPLEALLIRAVVPVLEEFPEFNATLAGDELLLHRRYDIGVAVDTPEGLMVVVVSDAAARSVAELGAEVARLATAARERTIAVEELRGQTFTISNIGAVGGRFGTPIVPFGTTAILSVGRADPRPVVRDGAVVVAAELPLSLSYDHRVIDGALGRRFLGTVVERIARGGGDG